MPRPIAVAVWGLVCAFTPAEAREPQPLLSSSGAAGADAGLLSDSELALFVSVSIGRPGTCEWPGRTADASAAAACRP